jgi:hypothetical protein
MGAGLPIAAGKTRIDLSGSLGGSIVLRPRVTRGRF